MSSFRQTLLIISLALCILTGWALPALWFLLLVLGTRGSYSGGDGTVFPSPSKSTGDWESSGVRQPQCPHSMSLLRVAHPFLSFLISGSSACSGLCQC